MTKQLLNEAYVGAVLQHERCAAYGMSHFCRCQQHQWHCAPVASSCLVRTPRPNWSKEAGITDKVQTGPHIIKVLLAIFERTGTNRHHPVLAAFANAYEHCATFDIKSPHLRSITSILRMPVLYRTSKIALSRTPSAHAAKNEFRLFLA